MIKRAWAGRHVVHVRSAFMDHILLSVRNAAFHIWITGAHLIGVSFAIRENDVIRV